MMLFDHTLSCCVSYLQFLILIVFTKVLRTKKKKNDTLFLLSETMSCKSRKNGYLEKGQLFQTVYFVLGYSQLTFWYLAKLILKIKYVEDHVICKQWELYFFFSNLEKANHTHTEVAYLICRELIIICKTMLQEKNIPIEK